MNIYLVCPVRNCDEKTQKELDSYVEKLELQGNKVHYPPRDVCQEDDGCGITICKAHRDAIFVCNEVHFWWDSKSTGSHFDFGMAYMLAMIKPIKFVMANGYDITEHKSYGNVISVLSNLEATND